MDAHSARELVNRSLDAADHAEVRSAALITDGNPPIPAFRIAITNGEADAVPAAPPELSAGSLEGTRSPMTVVPPI